MNSKTLCALFAAFTLLAGCATGDGVVKVGPGQSGGKVAKVGPGAATAGGASQTPLAVYAGTRLDVIVPVFDPGLPADSDQYEKKGIWPELRRAESNKFALNMKHALEDTATFGAVRVAPDASASGDLYVLGKILKSNGEDVRFSLQVVDISGRQWMNKIYRHRVKERFHKDLRNKGKDAYQPIFTRAAEDVAKLLRRKKDAQLAELRAVTEMRFAQSFAADAFAGYLRQSGGVTKLSGLPDENDPMLNRTRGIRVRDSLFIDNMQTHYENFDRKMSESYAVWQAAALTEAKAARKAKKKSIVQGIAGAAALIGGIAAAASTDNPAAADVAAVTGTIAGGALLGASFHNSAQAKVHREALAELGESLDIQLAPQVVEFEGRTEKLTGDAAEQFAQWRAFLQRIYEQEATPETQL